jgi:type II secretory pathway pseudopilin PulG
MRNLRKPQRGFTILEVAIAILLILLVGTTAASSLRMGLRTLSGPEVASVATSAIREFREFTLPMTIEEVDALDDTTIANPTLATGEPLPGADDMTLHVTVTPVDDTDPTVEVAPADSRSRIVAVTAVESERTVLEAQWLKTSMN